MKDTFTITVFGAESTGKTTLSRQLARKLNAKWRHEFARPYLEQTGASITTESMRDIWHGQKRLQELAVSISYHAVVQDTDLYSTVGYWKLPHVEPNIGTCPPELVADAARLSSDIYIVTTSNIPFEHDPIRYGGDRRESHDEYWINICERYELPYIVLTKSDQSSRLQEALNIVSKRIPACVVS